ncbi:MAG: hypothetical protein MJ094_09410 [Saccharofermentans sp.]|nr:hypothetical protein [Saccharofermentans sp.]
MEKLTKKLLALGLTTSLLMTSFTACSKTSDGRDVIDEDTPWYDLTKIVVGDDVDDSEFDYIYSQLAGTTEDYLVFYTYGSYKLPDNFNWDRDDYTEYQYEVIDICDYEGNTIDTVDIMEDYRALNLGDHGYVQGVEKSGEDFVVNIIAYSDDWSEETAYQATLNLDTFDLSSFSKVDADDIISEIISDDDASYEKTCYVGDYAIRTFWIYDDPCSYILLLNDSDNNFTKMDLRELLPDADIYDISTIIDIGEGKGLIIASTSSFESTKYYLLDTNDMSIEEYEEDMSWLDQGMYNIEYVEGFGSVFVNQDGINQIDFENHTMESVFSFNNTNANRYDINGVSPVLITEDRVILQGNNYTPSIGSSSMLPCIFIFDRAESNPHAGKAILLVASLGYYNYSICDCICRFNETNEDYFLQIDTRYELSDYIDHDSDEEDWEILNENATQALGNQLSIDLISGVGPDIIIDGANYSQLNNDDYLLDLSDYIDELDSDDYFFNIIDSARTGDYLFQLPLTFMVEGIVTDASNVEAGQIGFTYDEYNEFVDEVCNGDSPFSFGSQINFFIHALELMPDLMMEDGRINYDNDAFEALAEYTRDYVNDDVEEDDDVFIYDGFDTTSQPATLQYIVDMNTFINALVNTSTEKVLLGLPTYDGRGPVVGNYNSVAVAADLTSSEEEACLKYISLLLDDDTQYLLGVEAGIPINRNGFVEVAEDFVDQHNYELEHYYSDWTDADFRNNGMNPNPVDYSKIEDFEELISSTSSWVTTDAAVNAILREEVPAFFNGHKTLDQIIEVLENRIQTLIDERG